MVTRNYHITRKEAGWLSCENNKAIIRVKIEDDCSKNKLVIFMEIESKE